MSQILPSDIPLPIGASAKNGWTIIVGLALGCAAVLLLAQRQIDASLGAPAIGLPGVTVGTALDQVIVTSVRDGSVAEARGIVAGDAIIDVDHISIHSVAALQSYLRKDRATVVSVNVRHGRIARRVRLAFGEGSGGGQDTGR